MSAARTPTRRYMRHRWRKGTRAGAPVRCLTCGKLKYRVTNRSGKRWLTQRYTRCRLKITRFGAERVSP